MELNRILTQLRTKKITTHPEAILDWGQSKQRIVSTPTGPEWKPCTDKIILVGWTDHEDFIHMVFPERNNQPFMIRIDKVKDVRILGDYNGNLRISPVLNSIADNLKKYLGGVDHDRE